MTKDPNTEPKGVIPKVTAFVKRVIKQTARFFIVTAGVLLSCSYVLYGAYKLLKLFQMTSIAFAGSGAAAAAPEPVLIWIAFSFFELLYIGTHMIHDWKGMSRRLRKWYHSALRAASQLQSKINAIHYHHVRRMPAVLRLMRMRIKRFQRMIL